MRFAGPALLLFSLAAARPAAADLTIYDDELADGWSDYSWGGDYDFASTQEVHDGDFAIAAEPDGWGALSLRLDGGFAAQGWLTFWIEGDQPDLWIVLESDAEELASDPLPLVDVADVVAGVWTEVWIPLEPFGDHAWNRIDLQDASGFGALFHLDDVALVDELPLPQRFEAAEPVAADRLMLLGRGDVGAVVVELDGAPLAIVDADPHDDPHRTYLTLASPLTAGTLTVETADGTFTRTLRAAEAALGPAPTHDISPWIYGVALAPTTAYVATHGVTMARWGGNATSLYNPHQGCSNTGADWYFENVPAGPVEAWLDAMIDGGAATFLTVPALDHVARDDVSYSYSVARYGEQQQVDPFLPDAGNGVLTDGTPIDWNDPLDAATPWTPDDAHAWLASLDVVPDVAAVDNELDIAGQTHRDVHPAPMGHEELLARFTATSAAIRDALPDTRVAAPSSCCWWFYWNADDGIRPPGGQDLLPWFLDSVAAADADAGERSLHLLDVHYYPTADVYSDAADAEMRALRLRSTRSLWDPDYTDEGWIGDDADATDQQPDPNQVQLIPRLRALIDDHYPGTELAIGEWSWGAERDVSGGLAVADVLGIFGREQLDLASYWSYPPAGSPAAAGFRLYRGGDRPFAHRSVPVAFDDPDRLGVYAALDDDDRATLVVVNKHPDDDLLLTLAPALASGWSARHFGGALDGALVEHPSQQLAGAVVVPAHGAMLLASDDPVDLEPAAEPADCACATVDDERAAVRGALALAALVASLGTVRRRRRR